MNDTLWLFVGVTAFGVALALMASIWYRRTRTADLGTVSRQWVAEQRLGGTPDRHRG